MLAALVSERRLDRHGLAHLPRGGARRRVHRPDAPTLRCEDVEQDAGRGAEGDRRLGARRVSPGYWIEFAGDGGTYVHRDGRRQKIIAWVALTGDRCAWCGE